MNDLLHWTASSANSTKSQKFGFGLFEKRNLVLQFGWRQSKNYAKIFFSSNKTVLAGAVVVNELSSSITTLR